MTSLHDDMHRLATAITGSGEDASDIIQETMLKLWKVRRRIPPDIIEAEAYCFKSIRQNCYTFLSRKRPETTLNDLQVHSDDSSDSKVIFSDSQRMLMNMLEQLPDNQRIVMRLSSIEGVDISQTAKLTGLTEVNVRQLISRARKTLRARFASLNK